MSKILLLCSGLRHTSHYVQPFLKRLEVYLGSKCDCLDVRNAVTFDERTFFEYDQVIFIFTTAMNTIPSSTLEIFQKLETQIKKETEIYALIGCDEYEPEKCNLSEKILEKWCEKEGLIYKGALKVGSVLFIMNGSSKYIVSNYIKNFSLSVIKHEYVHLQISMLSDKIFMKKANQYWNKEIHKKQKEKAAHHLF